MDGFEVGLDSNGNWGGLGTDLGFGFDGNGLLEVCGFRTGL